VAIGNKDVAQALFESVGDDGIRWLFVCPAEDGWAITRNGRRVSVGTSDRASVQAGVAKYISFTTGPPSLSTACDPIVLEQLNRIEAKEAERRAEETLTSRQRRNAPATAPATSGRARKSIAKPIYTGTT
jgi:hypothetical protein